MPRDLQSRGVMRKALVTSNVFCLLCTIMLKAPSSRTQCKFSMRIVGNHARWCVHTVFPVVYLLHPLTRDVCTCAFGLLLCGAFDRLQRAVASMCRQHFRPWSKPSQLLRHKQGSLLTKNISLECASTNISWTIDGL